ncbi:MAG: ZIP family metal transporter [Candidatus Paceibacterota bacterium]
MIILVTFGAFVMTFLGGLFAIRFKDKLHLVLGFSAGAVVGVALFDLIPESIKIADNFWDVSTVMLVIAIGFVLYMVLDRILLLNCHEDDHHHRGRFGAGSFSFHSFIDGIAIGIAFGVSNVTGLVVATAVLAHDFSDGINTASMIMKHGGKKSEALKWVLLDAIAPVLGVLSTLFFTISESLVGLVLALFAGFFLYIGASDLLPESHHNHPTIWTTISTILGISVIYFAVTYAGI